MFCLILIYFNVHVHAGDQSASANANQTEVDRRIHQIIEMEDCDILSDLRALNGKQHTQYDVFWDEAQRFMSDVSAIDDRCHGQIAHLSRAISVRDFVEQVSQRCPQGTLIPSVEWTRLQFWPKNPSILKSLQLHW